jgi:glycerophosphoryl diester phosphodiesterase
LHASLHRSAARARPRRIPEGVERRIDRLATLGIDALNMHWRDWNPSRVERCHAAGVAAFGWDAQAPGSVARLVDAGIDAIYSDYPDRLTAALGS